MNEHKKRHPNRVKEGQTPDMNRGQTTQTRRANVRACVRTHRRERRREHKTQTAALTMRVSLIIHAPPPFASVQASILRRLQPCPRRGLQTSTFLGQDWSPPLHHPDHFLLSSAQISTGLFAILLKRLCFLR